MEYCTEQLRQHDYELYATTLFAAAGQQPSLSALYAFNLELEKIRLNVREPMMGLIRFQWWRDAVTKLFAGETLRHKVIEALSLSLMKHNLWKESDFHALIDANENRFQKNTPYILQDLWLSAGQIWTPLLRLVCQVSGATPDEGTITALGSSFEMSRLLKKFPEFLTEGKLAGLAADTPLTDFERTRLSKGDIACLMRQPLIGIVASIEENLSKLELADLKNTNALFIFYLTQRKVALIRKHGFDVFKFIENDTTRNLAFYLAVKNLMVRGKRF